MIGCKQCKKVIPLYEVHRDRYQELCRGCYAARYGVKSVGYVPGPPGVRCVSCGELVRYAVLHMRRVSGGMQCYVCWKAGKVAA